MMSQFIQIGANVDLRRFAGLGSWIPSAGRDQHPLLDRDPPPRTAAVAGQGSHADGLSSQPHLLCVLNTPPSVFHGDVLVERGGSGVNDGGGVKRSYMIWLAAGKEASQWTSGRYLITLWPIVFIDQAIVLVASILRWSCDSRRFPISHFSPFFPFRLQKYVSIPAKGGGTCVGTVEEVMRRDWPA